jgi:hypothetical protein
MPAAFVERRTSGGAGLFNDGAGAVGSYTATMAALAVDTTQPERVRLGAIASVTATLAGGPGARLNRPVDDVAVAEAARERGREAGVPGRAHGLRKAGATIAAEGGASAHELMAMYTWTRLNEAERYTQAASRRILSASTAERIEAKFRREIPTPAEHGVGENPESPMKTA